MEKCLIFSVVVAAERGRGRHSELKESQRAFGHRWSTGTKLQYPALTVSDAFSLGCEFDLRSIVSGTFWLPDMRSYPVCKIHTWFDCLFFFFNGSMETPCLCCVISCWTTHLLVPLLIRGCFSYIFFFWLSSLTVFSVNLTENVPQHQEILYLYFCHLVHRDFIY